METLKNIISNITYIDILNYISTPYSFKMGGTKTLVVDNKQELFLDQKEIYRGRGNKYNTSIRYENQIYDITSEQLEEYKKLIGKKKYEQQKRLVLINKEFKQIFVAKKVKIVKFIIFSITFFCLIILASLLVFYILMKKRMDSNYKSILNRRI